MIDLRKAINIDLADDSFCTRINGLWRFSIDRRFVVRSREHNFRKSHIGAISFSRPKSHGGLDVLFAASRRTRHDRSNIELARRENSIYR